MIKWVGYKFYGQVSSIFVHKPSNAVVHITNHYNQPLETVIAEVVNQSLQYRAPIDFNEAFGNRICQGL